MAPTPTSPAVRIARPGRRVRLSAVAAGPTSSAVDRIAPIVTAESATARAIASRYRPPITRTGSLLADASSGLTDASSRGR